MRHRLHILLALVSCCFLLNQGCNIDDKTQNQPRADNQKDQNNKTSNGDELENTDEAKETLPTEQAPVNPGIVPPPPPPPPPFIFPIDGKGGGSQGSSKPARTGNKDDRAQNPDAVCGNGVQEVRNDNPLCPFDIYGSTTDGPEGLSNLVGFNLDDEGIGNIIGVIGPNIERVSAIDFGPDGILYGVGEQSDNGDVSVFFTINCQTAQATIIGPTEIEDLSGASGEVITDIDFDSFGRLWAYVTAQMPVSEFFGLINPLTGLFTEIGISGVIGDGNGIGSTPFPVDTLYHTSDDDLRIINRLTGASTFFTPLIFSPPADDPAINAVDNDPFSNIVYVSLNDGSDENYLAVLNVNSGVVSFLAPVPFEAPDGLDGIAVNRRYEECDPLASIPTLPPGTICSELCLLQEDICSDAIDNDSDGLIDCLDPDCLGETCNDADGCTLEDTCVPGDQPEDPPVCEGTPVNCEIIEDVANECTVDICVELSDEPGDDNFKCNSTIDPEKLIFGSCTPDGNCDGERNPDGTCDPEDIEENCLVGRCIEVENDDDDDGDDDDDAEITVECEGGEKEFIPIAEGGCEDGNSCTADDCEEDEGGICDYDSLDAIPCGDDNLCTLDTGVCELGECLGLTPVGACEIDADCPSGFCFDTGDGGICTCSDENGCTNDLCGTGEESGLCVSLNLPNTCILNADCGVNGDCTNIVNGVGTCACDAPECVNDSFCLDGNCTAESVDDTLCDIEGFCIDGFCTIEGCVSVIMSGPTPCTVIVDGSVCDGLILCDEGEEDSLCEPIEPLEDCIPINK